MNCGGKLFETVETPIGTKIIPELEKYFRLFARQAEILSIPFHSFGFTTGHRAPVLVND